MSIGKKRLVIHEKEARREPDICGVALELINRDTSYPKNVSIATLLIEPGKSSTEHYHKRTEEIYYIIDGSGVVEISGKSYTVETGHAVLIPIGEKHRIENTGTNVLKFLSVDAPIFDPEDVIIV